MIVVNNKMAARFHQAIFSDKRLLQPGLNSILEKGFIFKDGCYFLAAFSKNIRTSPGNFTDKTGHECFVNSFHLDDYIEDRYIEQAFQFAREIFRAWHQIEKHLILKCIIGQTDSGVNIRFHVVRENEHWINEVEIDNFEEAICILTSNAIK